MGWWWCKWVQRQVENTNVFGIYIKIITEINNLFSINYQIDFVIPKGTARIKYETDLSISRIILVTG